MIGFEYESKGRRLVICLAAGAVEARANREVCIGIMREIYEPPTAGRDRARHHKEVESEKASELMSD